MIVQCNLLNWYLKKFMVFEPFEVFAVVKFYIMDRINRHIIKTLSHVLGPHPLTEFSR